MSTVSAVKWAYNSYGAFMPDTWSARLALREELPNGAKLTLEQLSQLYADVREHDKSRGVFSYPFMIVGHEEQHSTELLNDLALKSKTESLVLLWQLGAERADVEPLIRRNPLLRTLPFESAQECRAILDFNKMLKECEEWEAIELWEGDLDKPLAELHRSFKNIPDRFKSEVIGLTMQKPGSKITKHNSLRMKFLINYLFEDQISNDESQKILTNILTGLSNDLNNPEVANLKLDANRDKELLTELFQSLLNRQNLCDDEHIHKYNHLPLETMVSLVRVSLFEAYKAGNGDLILDLINKNNFSDGIKDSLKQKVHELIAQDTSLNIEMLEGDLTDDDMVTLIHNKVRLRDFQSLVQKTPEHIQERLNNLHHPFESVEKVYSALPEPLRDAFFQQNKPRFFDQCFWLLTGHSELINFDLKSYDEFLEINRLIEDTKREPMPQEVFESIQNILDGMPLHKKQKTALILFDFSLRSMNLRMTDLLLSGDYLSDSTKENILKNALNNPLSKDPQTLYLDKSKQALLKILKSDMEVSNHLADLRYQEAGMMEDWSESSMDQARIKQSKQYFIEKIKPVYEEAFRALQDTGLPAKEGFKSGLIAVEEKIRLSILDKILNDEPDNTKLVDFIKDNKEALAKGDNPALMKNARENYLNTPNNLLHAAWRGYDPKNPITGYENYLIPHDKKANNTIREMCAYYYLFAFDENANRTEAEQEDIQLNYMIELGELLRAHSEDHHGEPDSPSCFPGYFGRILNMAFQPELISPEKSIVQAAEKVVARQFKSYLESLKTHKECEKFLKAIGQYTKQNCMPLLLETKGYGYKPELIEVLNKFCSPPFLSKDEFKRLVNKELEANGQSFISGNDTLFLDLYLASPGINSLGFQGDIYARHIKENYPEQIEENLNLVEMPEPNKVMQQDQKGFGNPFDDELSALLKRNIPDMMKAPLIRSIESKKNKFDAVADALKAERQELFNDDNLIVGVTAILKALVLDPDAYEKLDTNNIATTMPQALNDIDLSHVSEDMIEPVSKAREALIATMRPSATEKASSKHKV